MKSPTLRGVVLKIAIVTPKKPNSARRSCVKLRLSNNKKPIVHIPGIGHNLRKYSDVLVAGIGPKDLPGVRHTCIRGNRGLDCVWSKKKRRSIYGVKRPDALKTIIRRKFRKLLGK